MTPEMKKHLEAVVVNIANEKSEDAQEAFSSYLRLKTQEILGEAHKDDDKCSKCDCDPCECDDEDKDDKKKDKKDKKKNPFAKKDDDKDDDKDEDKDEDKDD